MAECPINFLPKATVGLNMTQGVLTVTDNEMVRWMRSQNDPAFVAVELANEFDVTTETARKRLEGLEAEGRVIRKKPARRTVLWWLPEDHGPEFSA